MKTNPFGERVQLIADDMKQCFKDLGLPIHAEIPKEQGISMLSRFDYESHTANVTASFYPEVNLMEIVLVYAQVPKEKMNQFLDLFNQINQTLVMGYYSINPEHRLIQLRASFYVNQYSLNKEHFKRMLNHCLATGHAHVQAIAELLFTDKTPETIINEHHQRTGFVIPPECIGPNGEMRKPGIKEDRPFVVEWCADLPLFPTHTHGLAKVGMPEFLIDPLAFGPMGNDIRINLSYDYFRKPENAEKLEAIKRGETITLTIQDLDPKTRREPHPYCYRRVYPDFEMVKQAYNLDDPEEVGPETWFVQIYVEGDDFALTDEYYRGGIKW